MPGRQASERLVAVVREAISQAGWRLRELEAIAVVTGPGSFTGVRVGLSVAKGLGEAAGVPLIAISRLATLAAAAGPGSACALLDAGRGEFYCGQFRDGEALGEVLFAREGAVAAALLAGGVVASEEAVAKSLSPEVAARVVAEPAASDALPLALKRLAAGSFDDPLTLDANYLRRTDAEIFAKPVAPHSG
jgi:tRNA threonylcarbamoyladenosine biosynthesis protein TsaB